MVALAGSENAVFQSLTAWIIFLMLRFSTKSTIWPKAVLSAVIAFGCGLTLLFLYLVTGLPSTRLLQAYLPDRQTELAPQQCVAGALTVVPAVVTMTLEPALFAAEGRDMGVAASLFRTSTVKGGHYSLQIARGLLCDDRRSHIRRSLDEIVLALKIDAAYSPEQRYAIYLNRANFGDGIFGVAAASDHHFKKSPGQLTIAEGALLAGLLRSPGSLSLSRHPDRALCRRNSVLANMQRQGSISAEDASIAQAAPLLTRGHNEAPGKSGCR